MSLSGWRILAGRLFQSRGPAAANCEAPIAEPCVGPWNAARVDVGRSEPATAGVRDKLEVVYKICCSCIMQRLVDQEGQLEIDSLSDWKPVEFPQHWCDVVTSTITSDESRCRVLRRLQAPEQTVCDAVMISLRCL